MPARSPGPPRGLLRPRAPAGRFEHERVAPSEDLAPFIAHFWWVRWDLRGAPAFVAETLPHPTVHLIFDGRRAEVRGVATGAFRKRLSGEGHTFGIKFRPGAFHPWLGASVSTITDRALPLRAIPALASTPRLARAIHDACALVVARAPAGALRGGSDASALVIARAPTGAIRGGSDASVRAGAIRGVTASAPAGSATAVAVAAAATALAPVIAVAEAALRAHLPALPTATAAIRDLVERMAIDATITRTETVAELAGLDLRTLQRRFARFVGVSPKWVVQRYRLHEAAARLTALDPPTLAALAASLGYFDQAHFTRDFKAVVGASPSGYREPTARS